MSRPQHPNPDDPSAAAIEPQLVDPSTFNSDVNEVFLLIDYISGRSEKSLSDIDTKDIELPAEQGTAVPTRSGDSGPDQPVPAPQSAKPSTSEKPSVPDVLYRLCQIGYPPHPDPMTRAHKAAFVLLLKDRLNGLSSPARGITVAYTTMFVTATDGCRIRTRPAQQAGHAPNTNRSVLAKEAYPLLESHARCFARAYRWFPWLLMIVLILTASAYWDVGFGRTIVQRIEQLEIQRVGLLRPGSTGAPWTVPLTKDTYCAPATDLKPDQLEACGRLKYLTERINDSRDDLFCFALATSASTVVTGAGIAAPTDGSSVSDAAACASKSSNTLVRVLAWVRPMTYGFMLDSQAPSRDRPEATVAWILSLYSAYVLPGMFGLLGTLAAAMRSIQAKVRDSLLGPRDFPLSVLGVVMGPVAGLAVGLFFTPTEASTSGAAGLAGSVNLSASGLGFLAGYGAEAFFRFVDALLVRIFALEQPAK